MHDNVVQSCTLSFSCWLQGGRHGEGCGSNKWLFSCCIQEKTEKHEKYEKQNESKEPFMNMPSADDFDEIMPPTSYSHNKHIIKANYLYKNEIDLPLRVQIPNHRLHRVHPMKQNMLRRRIDDDPVSDKIIYAQ